MNMFNIVVVDDIEYFDNIINTGFYITCNDFFFPDYQWTDFPVGILHMWVDSIISVFGKEKCKFELNFMDGPYRLECLKEKDGVAIQFIDSHNDNYSKCVFSCIVSFTQLAKEISDSIFIVKKLINKYSYPISEITEVIKRKEILDKLLTNINC